MLEAVAHIVQTGSTLARCSDLMADLTERSGACSSCTHSRMSTVVAAWSLQEGSAVHTQLTWMLDGHGRQIVLAVELELEFVNVKEAEDLKMGRAWVLRVREMKMIEVPQSLAGKMSVVVSADQRIVDEVGKAQRRRDVVIQRLEKLVRETLK